MAKDLFFGGINDLDRLIPKKLGKRFLNDGARPNKQKCRLQ
jgi:hypothetical protein